MDDIVTTTEAPRAELPPPATVNPDTTQEKRYVGNSFDLYALIAGIVGVTSLAMCFTGNMIIYCLPFVPLVFGIIALRNSARSLDPSRTRTMGWIGVAAGALGVVVLVVLAMLVVVYFVFIFSLIMQTMPRRP
jgi:hypothetical protein